MSTKPVPDLNILVREFAEAREKLVAEQTRLANLQNVVNKKKAVIDAALAGVMPAVNSTLPRGTKEHNGKKIPTIAGQTCYGFAKEQLRLNPSLEEKQLRELCFLRGFEKTLAAANVLSVFRNAGKAPQARRLM